MNGIGKLEVPFIAYANTILLQYEKLILEILLSLTVQHLGLELLQQIAVMQCISLTFRVVPDNPAGQGND